MPVEPATYISDLDVTNPPAADPLAQASDQLRLIKSVLKTTFPNLVGVVTASATTLSALGAALVANVFTVPGGTASGTSAKVVLKGCVVSGTPTPDVTVANFGGNASFANTGGTVTLGVDQAGNMSALASVNAPSLQQNGSPLIPAGCVIMWGGTIATIPAGWHICDGTAGTPDLRSRFIIGASTSLGAGSLGGSTTYTGITDSQGSHSHGGTTAGGGAHAHGGTTDAQGSHSHGGNTGGHALTIAEMPSHDHGLGSQNILGNVGGTNVPNGGPWGAVGFTAQGGNAVHTHPVSVDGAHAHNITTNTAAAHQHGVSVDGAHTHNVAASGLPPYVALAYIMKI